MDRKEEEQRGEENGQAGDKTQPGPQVSKAAPMPSHISGGGFLVHQRFTHEAKRPDWREWSHTPNVRGWQACALSLDIDPHSICVAGDDWMVSPGSGPIFERESFPDEETGAKFDLRMRVLVANLGSDRFSEHRTAVDLRRPGNSFVGLDEFSSWARSIGWDIPPELDTIEPPRPSGKWPWGEYETELLRLLDAAARRFWVNYDPGDPGSAPTSSEVMAWLKEQKADISSRETEAIAKILRADGLPMGRRG